MNSTSASLAAAPAVATPEDRSIAIISYLTLIGFVAAVVMHGSKKTALGAFHLRQSLGLMATSVALIFVGMLFAVVPVLGWLLDLGLWLGLIALWFLAFLSAVKGERKPVAWVGHYFQGWFSGAFD